MRVWDVFVRVFHWTVVVTFFVAYFTEDDLLTLHVWAGYVLGVFVVMRIAWGFVGPKHARFTDFVCGPIKVWTYLVDLVAFRAKRYLGHSPAGGAMALALLIGLLAVVWTGLELYAVEENAGPLASISPTTAAPGLLVLVSEDDNEDEEREEFWEELHEWLSNLVFVLVILHIAGVLLASIVHGENLSRAMVTGLKRPED
jgi:cytochrome b